MLLIRPETPGKIIPIPRTAGFLVEAALDIVGGGGLSRCLTDEVQRRFGLGGLLFAESVWHVVLSRFFIFCFFRHFFR